MRASTFASIGVLLVTGIGGAAGCGANVVFGDPDVCVFGDETYQVGDTFDDGCNECTCEAGGAIGCTKRQCEGECVDGGVSHPVGTSWDAGDGCNTCTCEAAGVASCTNMACTDCGDVPPACPQPPDGCFYDGPICIDGEWSCGDLVCEMNCSDDPPLCLEPPGDCTVETVCAGTVWQCDPFCADFVCEDEHPVGFNRIVELVYEFCGCSPETGECFSECDGFCEGNAPTDLCTACVTESVDQGFCATEAATSSQCQNHPDCAAYIECVIES